MKAIYGLYVDGLMPVSYTHLFPLELRPAFQTEPLRGLSPKGEGLGGVLIKGVSTPEKRRFEESGLASVTERPTGVKARKLRVLAQPLPSPAFHYFKGRVCFRDRASLRAMARKMRQ